MPHFGGSHVMYGVASECLRIVFPSYHTQPRTGGRSISHYLSQGCSQQRPEDLPDLLPYVRSQLFGVLVLEAICPWILPSFWVRGCLIICTGGNTESRFTIEFIPGSHQYLLTVLSIWWAFGQLIGSLVNYSTLCIPLTKLWSP